MPQVNKDFMSETQDTNKYRVTKIKTHPYSDFLIYRTTQYKGFKFSYHTIQDIGKRIRRKQN